MPVREFPALGLDPAPGEPAALHALGSDVARHARSLAGSSQRIAGVRATGWVGQAADAFAADIAPLPGDLGRSADAFGTVASALGTYANELDAAQRHADTLEQRAAQARSARQVATARVDVLRHGPHGETDSSRIARETDLRVALLRVDDADAELAAILREAHGLEEHAFGVAEQTSRQIRAAAEQAPYREPNLLQQGLDLFQRGWQSSKEWAREHADVLRTVSTALKAIAAAAAVVALAVQFIPVIGQIVGTIPLAVAAIAGGAALGIDVLLKLSTGEGSWAMLGLDIALTVIPGAALIRAGKGLLRPAGHALGALARTPFVARLVRPVATTIHQVGRAVPGMARTFRSRLAELGHRLADETGSIGVPPGRAPEGSGPGGQRLVRQDDDFNAPVSKEGIPKAHIDGRTGELVPANPTSNRPFADHILNPRGNADSPYISFSTPEGAARYRFGSQQIELDLVGLQRDIAAGRVRGVEIVTHQQIKEHLRARAEQITGFQVDFDHLLEAGGPQRRINKVMNEVATMRHLFSDRNTFLTFNRIMTGIANNYRLEEHLVKGIVPPDYFDNPYSI